MLVRVGSGSSAIDPQLKIVWAPVANGEGTGYLTASGGTIAFTAIGAATAGTGVAIGDGARVKAYGYASATQFVVVDRSGTDALSCTAVPLVFDLRTDPFEQLTDCQASIAKAQEAIAAQAGDERIQRATPADLTKREQYLLKQVATRNGTAPRVAYADFSTTGDGSSC